MVTVIITILKIYVYCAQIAIAKPQPTKQKIKVRVDILAESDTKTVKAIDNKSTTLYNRDNLEIYLAFF